jgi:hypothetical protein
LGEEDAAVRLPPLVDRHQVGQHVELGEAGERGVLAGAVFSDAQGNPLRVINHVEHTSNDVNSVTGFTVHEHNHYVVIEDFVGGTITLNGAINIMQRRGIGSVIQNTGHKVIDAETGEPITLAGPNKADDADFCAAIAP